MLLLLKGNYHRITGECLAPAEFPYPIFGQSDRAVENNVAMVWENTSIMRSDRTFMRMTSDYHYRRT